ncbi:MFS transporter, partial [Carnobacterium sp.]
MNKQATHSQQSMSSYQKKVLASSSAGLGLESMDIMFLTFALTSIIADLNVSGAAAGLISSITNVGMLLGGVTFGILADRFGRIKIFTYTILIFAFATGAMYFASNIYLVYLFRFLSGIGAGGEYGIGMAIVAEAFPKEKLG